MSLMSISPLDGRYTDKTSDLAPFVSEFGLIYYRLKVEIAYFVALTEQQDIPQCPSLSKETIDYLNTLLANFDQAEAEQVKCIEQTTNHDVKAVEYYLKNKFQAQPQLEPLQEFIHFGLTSEDVNNLAYALMIKGACQKIMQPKLASVITALKSMAKQQQDLAMMARTHGQTASPTTLGKELANVVARLERGHQLLNTQHYLGKCNGAVGNYNALQISYPDVDWPSFSQRFIEQSLGLTQNKLTTQIEPHDWIAELCHTWQRINTVLIDFSRDIWHYISIGYFVQKTKEGEVGSSTMPHKVNPIDFENSEGNLGIANAVLQFMAEKLPISRLQRDLSDSTVLRNIGVGFGHSLIAQSALLKGLNKLQASPSVIGEDLSKQWALLAEPIQTVMRKHGLETPYEQLKTLTRGKVVSKEDIHQFIENSALPIEEKQRLLQLTPQTYTGLASDLIDAL